MTRGKHASAAARRREFEALQQRADRAERAEAACTAELAALRESSERQINGLRVDLSDMTKQRDEGTSPRLLEAEQRIRDLMAKRDAQGELKNIQEVWLAVMEKLSEVLTQRGMGPLEVEEMRHLLAAGDPDVPLKLYFAFKSSDPRGSVLAP